LMALRIYMTHSKLSFGVGQARFGEHIRLL
jgi:hypothetical protein